MVIAAVIMAGLGILAGMVVLGIRFIEWIIDEFMDSVRNISILLTFLAVFFGLVGWLFWFELVLKIACTVFVFSFPSIFIFSEKGVEIISQARLKVGDVIRKKRDKKKAAPDIGTKWEEKEMDKFGPEPFKKE